MICADFWDKIFGWTFDGLEITVQLYHCEDLYAAGHVEEATKTLLKILDTFNEVILASTIRDRAMGRYRYLDQIALEWRLLSDLKRKCIDALEALGDTALHSGEYDNAISRYTSAMSLDPSSPVNILLKRSRARASKGLWQDALTDANEVCILS